MSDDTDDPLVYTIPVRFEGEVTALCVRGQTVKAAFETGFEESAVLGSSSIVWVRSEGKD